VTNLGGSKHSVPLEDRKDLVFGALTIIISRSPAAMPTFTRMAMHAWDTHVTMSMLYIIGRVDDDTPIRTMFSNPDVRIFSIEDASKTLAAAFESIFPDRHQRDVVTKTMIESFYEPARLVRYALELGHQKREGKSAGKRDFRQPGTVESGRYLRQRTTDEDLDSMRKKKEIHTLRLSMDENSQISTARDGSMASGSGGFDSITNRIMLATQASSEIPNAGQTIEGNEINARMLPIQTDVGRVICDTVPRKEQQLASLVAESTSRTMPATQASPQIATAGRTSEGNENDALMSPTQTDAGRVICDTFPRKEQQSVSSVAESTSRIMLATQASPVIAAARHEMKPRTSPPPTDPAGDIRESIPRKEQLPVDNYIPRE
jgi:hypothetical protein